MSSRASSDLRTLGWRVVGARDAAAPARLSGVVQRSWGNAELRSGSCRSAHCSVVFSYKPYPVWLTHPSPLHRGQPKRRRLPRAKGGTLLLISTSQKQARVATPAEPTPVRRLTQQLKWGAHISTEPVTCPVVRSRAARHCGSLPRAVRTEPGSGRPPLTRAAARPRVWHLPQYWLGVFVNIHAQPIHDQLVTPSKFGMIIGGDES